MVSEGSPVRVDTGLLRGFRFRCRTDCGLCCFATPRVDRDERDRILAQFPEARFLSVGRGHLLAVRSNGGACQFLDRHRCRAHAVRPFPCREFPITVHVGHRLQASVVLSCPGLGPGPLEVSGDRAALAEPEGLAEELAAIAARLGPSAARRRAEASRRGRKVERQLREQGRWNDPDRVRALLTEDVPLPDADDFPVEDPPALDEGVERLPLFYDLRDGPVALSGGLGGWEAIELDPLGRHRPLAALVPPDRPPELDAAARRLLVGYLRYWLDRDAFLAAVHQEMLHEPEGTVLDWARIGLLEIGAQTLARASVRQKLRLGEAGRLGREEIWRGIAATDQDWLDRPTWGERL